VRRVTRRFAEVVCPPEMRACDGQFTESHAQMCRLHLDAYDHLSVQIAELDQLVAAVAAADVDDAAHLGARARRHGSRRRCWC